MTGLTERAEPRRPPWQVPLRVVLVLVLVYLFLAGMGMLGQGARDLGRNPDYRPDAPAGERGREFRDGVYTVFSFAENPVVALFVGMLATSVFQSSSFTVSFIVALVVTTPLTLSQAIFMVMGCNIGTCVTNAGVSFTQIRRADEFERAHGAAVSHEIFNSLTVLVLLPVEIAVRHWTGQGLLERIALGAASRFYRGTPLGGRPTNYLKEAVAPLVDGFAWLLRDGLGLGRAAAGALMALVGVVLLFAALLLVTNVLRGLVMKRVERVFDRVLFRNALTGFLVGLMLTMTVQCSSITTSLLVPLVAAGLLTIRQAYPYTLGANIGTTVTALIASFATEATTSREARIGIALAVSHTVFNIIGCLIWWPLRRVPVGLAQWHARRAARSKVWAVAHIVGYFFVLPALVIALCALLR